MPNDAVNPGVERTGSQVAVSYGMGDYLYQAFPTDVTYATYREIRKDPTVALVRALVSAIVLVGEWSVEAKDDVEDDRIRLVTDHVLKHRQAILEPAMSGGIDFGWAPFELVFEVVDGEIGVKKVKPLLQDITTILIDPTTGAFRGYRQRYSAGNTVDLIGSLLHIAFRVEGDYWYGQNLLENIRAAYNGWHDANDGASRYDRKIAGSHFVVHYPLGKSLYKGVDTDNGEIAAIILRALESSGSISVPDELREFADEQNKYGPKWRIELLQDSSARQGGFLERLRYFDVLKCRGLGVPERMILEGEFGTKAEAGVHANAGTLNIQLLDQHIAEEVNKQFVDLLLEMNYGPDAKGTVWIEPAPLVDDQLILLKRIYEQVLGNAQGFAEEFGTIDTDALKDAIGVPKRSEVAQAGDMDEILPPEMPAAEGQEEVEAAFVPRTERGRWTYDGAGLADYFGNELEPADQAFQTARRLANDGKFDEARQMLYSIRRPRDDRAHFAVQRRTSQMLERFLRIEHAMITRSKRV